MSSNFYDDNPSGKQQYMLTPVAPSSAAVMTTRNNDEPNLLHVKTHILVICSGCYSPVVEIHYKEHILECLPFEKFMVGDELQLYLDRKKESEKRREKAKRENKT